MRDARYWPTPKANLFVAAFFTATVLQAVDSPVARAEPLPQPLTIKRLGLEPKTNPIDQLISKFGFACINLKGLKCRIDGELDQFLRELSSNRADPADYLQRLGANCEQKDAYVNCTYERFVRDEYWGAQGAQPMRIVSEHFKIEFVIDPTSPSNNRTVFNRTTTVTN